MSMRSLATLICIYIYIIQPPTFPYVSLFLLTYSYSEVGLLAERGEHVSAFLQLSLLIEVPLQLPIKHLHTEQGSVASSLSLAP